jgi:hypothetical protein
MALYFCPEKTETPTKNEHRKNRLIDYNMCEMWWFLLSLSRKPFILHSKTREIGYIDQVIRICIYKAIALLVRCLALQKCIFAPNAFCKTKCNGLRCKNAFLHQMHFCTKSILFYKMLSTRPSNAQPLFFVL